MAPDSTLPRLARSGLRWHLVNGAGASLCGAAAQAGDWEEWRTDADGIAAVWRCGICRGRAHWLRAERPKVPHVDRAGYARWLQVQWWLAGGLVFPASSAQHAQEGRA